MIIKKILPKRIRHFLWWRQYHLKRYIKGKINNNKSTYSNIDMSAISNICHFNNMDLNIAIEDYVNHRFSILGTNNQQVSYDSKYSGFEQKRYNFYQKWDKNGKFLSKMVNKGNLKYSQRVWRILFELYPDYEPIDWQRDFKSGYRWDSKKHHLLIEYGKKEGVDVKLPWELSRFQYLIQMGITYKSNKNKDILKEFQGQIFDFIATNPPEFGVNWACTMDVAIRAANWVIAYSFFEKDIDNSFRKIFYTSLYDHGKFIINNLENKKKLINNHYLSDISGLFILSLALKNSIEEANEWYLFAMKELKREIKEQAYSDGTDFEGSTYYHRLALELFFYPVYFANRNGEDVDKLFGKEYLNSLESMFEALFYLLKPDGRMPQIGDNDSGQFFKWFDYDEQYMGYLLLTGSLFFDKKEWKTEFFEQKYKKIDQKLLKMLFEDSNWDKYEYIDSKDIEYIKAFEDSGWYIYRKGLNYLIFSCGPVGQKGFGGHSHNHQLSFELMIEGKDIIVDPGTYVYTPSPYWRNFFRSIKAHNAPFIEEKEPDDISKNLFYKEDNSFCEGFIKEENDKTIIGGKHKGFGFEMERKIEIYKDKIIIKDTPNEKLKKSLIFSPFCSINTQKNVIFTQNITKMEVENIEKREEWFYSSEYGKKVKTNRIVYKGDLTISL